MDLVVLIPPMKCTMVRDKSLAIVSLESGIRIGLAIRHWSD
jgi:hypothetical protein